MKLAHWSLIVETHGPVRRYWAWVMERMNKMMKKLIYTTNFKKVEVILERKKKKKKDKELDQFFSVS